MSLSAYFWGIRLFTALALTAFLGIVFAVDPNEAEFVGIVLFFSSLFGMCLGLCTLFVTGLYCKAIGEASAAHHLGGAFRQAFFLSLFVIGNALFQFFGILTWWDSLLLLAGILLLEFSVRQFIKKSSSV